jgi:hypothetical protein
MNTKICFLIHRENNSKLSRKRQTDTQNLYHLLHHGPIMAKETEMDALKSTIADESLEQSWMRIEKF